MFNSSLISVFFLFLVLTFLPVDAAAPRFYTSNPEKLMLDGYDVVSYYFSAEPRIGSPEYEIEFSGVKWRFVNQSNLNRFKKNPGMFIPEYGGYCVWAIAHGRLTGGLPQYWKIVNGKLYFFCSEDSLNKWMVKRALINRLALDNWPQILEK